MIVKFFIFLMQSGGVLLQQKSTANTDECIYSAYFEIISAYVPDPGQDAVHIRLPGFRVHWRWRE